MAKGKKKKNVKGRKSASLEERQAFILKERLKFAKDRIEQLKELEESFISENTEFFLLDTLEATNGTVKILSAELFETSDKIKNLLTKLTNAQQYNIELQEGILLETKNYNLLKESTDQMKDEASSKFVELGKLLEMNHNIPNDFLSNYSHDTVVGMFETLLNDMREINISQELAYSKLEVKESALAKSNLFATEKSNEICLSSPQIESHSVALFLFKIIKLNNFNEILIEDCVTALPILIAANFENMGIALEYQAEEMFLNAISDFPNNANIIIPCLQVMRILLSSAHKDHYFQSIASHQGIEIIISIIIKCAAFASNKEWRYYGISILEQLLPPNHSQILNDRLKEVKDIKNLYCCVDSKEVFINSDHSSSLQTTFGGGQKRVFSSDFLESLTLLQGHSFEDPIERVSMIERSKERAKERALYKLPYISDLMDEIEHEKYFFEKKNLYKKKFVNQENKKKANLDSNKLAATETAIEHIYLTLISVCEANINNNVLLKVSMDAIAALLNLHENYTSNLSFIRSMSKDFVFDAPTLLRQWVTPIIVEVLFRFPLDVVVQRKGLLALERLFLVKFNLEKSVYTKMLFQVINNAAKRFTEEINPDVFYSAARLLKIIGMPLPFQKKLNKIQERNVNNFNICFGGTKITTYSVKVEGKEKGM